MCIYTGYCFIANDNLVWQYRVDSVSFFYTGVVCLILLWHSNVKTFRVPWNLLYKEQCLSGNYLMCVIAYDERSVRCASVPFESYDPFVWWFGCFNWSASLDKGTQTITNSISFLFGLIMCSTGALLVSFMCSNDAICTFSKA